jgi:hypothetical protein
MHSVSKYMKPKDSWNGRHLMLVMMFYVLQKMFQRELPPYSKCQCERIEESYNRYKKKLKAAYSQNKKKILF